MRGHQPLRCVTLGVTDIRGELRYVEELVLHTWCIGCRLACHGKGKWLVVGHDVELLDLQQMLEMVNRDVD